MEFKKILLSDLIPDKKNPRKNLQPEDPEFKKINTSIERFGFLEPIVFNTKTKKILGGHQRLKVVKNRGAVSLHVIQLGAYSWAFTDDDLKELSEQEESAANIALNKAKGDWAVDQLVENLKELKTEGMLDLTGFDEKEFDTLIKGRVPEAGFGEEFALPTGDQKFAYLTYTMSVDQADFIKAQLEPLKKELAEPGEFETANGNALYHAVSQWAAQKK